MTDADKVTPTEAGKLRYPPAGFYVIDADWREPCTCHWSCMQPCKGECGCRACSTAWQDFLSMPD